MKLFKLFIINIATLLTCTAYCNETIKIAFLAPTEKNGQILATFNGVLDIFKTLNNKYSKTFKLEYFNCNKSTNAQISQIANSEKLGFKGVIILPTSNDSSLENQITTTNKSLPVIVLGDELTNSKPLCFIGTDATKFEQSIADTIKSSSKGDKIELFCYLKSESEFIEINLNDNKKISQMLLDSMKYNTFNSILKNYNPTIYGINFYSIFEQTHKNEIKRRDDFGEIFFDPTILLSPIKKDDDRIFAIVVGATAQTEIQLASKSITACIYEDYYGWGYFAGRSISEKIVENIAPTSPKRYLPTIVATPATIESFRKDWQVWSK